MSTHEFYGTADRILRLASELRGELDSIIRMGPNFPYQGPLRMSKDQLDTLQIIVASMRQSDQPLFFVKTPTLDLRPGRYTPRAYSEYEREGEDVYDQQED